MQQNPIKCLLKALLRKCKQNQIFRNRQRVDPVAPNSDNFIDSTVPVYPIHIE